MGDTGGASRLEPIVSSILPSVSQKEKMNRKETQRSILLIVRYIRKNKDGKKRHTKYLLAGAEIHHSKTDFFLKFENRKVTIFIVKLGRIAVLNILFFSASAIIKHY